MRKFRFSGTLRSRRLGKHEPQLRKHDYLMITLEDLPRMSRVSKDDIRRKLSFSKNWRDDRTNWKENTKYTTKKIREKKKNNNNNTRWDPRRLKQFSKVLPLFCILVYFIACDSAKCISLDFDCLICFFCLFFLWIDVWAGKIEYFIVSRAKSTSSAGKDNAIVYWAHFCGNSIGRFYPCPWPCRVYAKNSKSLRFSKRWTIVWTLVNCPISLSRQTFERRQVLSAFQREDEGFKSVATGPLCKWLCKTKTIC